MAGSGRHHEGRRRQGRGRAAEDFGARARERSAVLRRLRQPARRRRVRQGLLQERRRRSTSTRRSTCSCSASRRKRSATASRRSTSSWPRARRPGQARGGAHRDRSADRRDPRVRRRPRLQPVAVQPRDRRASGSRDPCSSRSSISRRSSGWRAKGRADLTPATVVVDEPTTFKDGENDYTPSNYQNEYDGPITLRRALALSRNIVAIKVAEATGYDRVADLWKRVGVGTPARAYPSIALGVFEATPFDMATAYTLFANGGTVRPLTAITTDRRERQGAPRSRPVESRLVARADTTYLVDEHDAQRHQRGHRRRRARAPGSRSMPPASPARPTICATPGSSDSRRSC